MGDLIRFVSSHEVGHTLGLRHNFGSSSTVPVEMLRNKAFVEANGHTPSIMDYARFNYVAQPEDNIKQVGIYPRIGDYDKWAIEWGYKVMPEYKSAEAEVSALSKLSVERLKDRRLFFGTESNQDDPHSQSEDLGDNAMKASSYGIKNLQRILVKLPEWTSEKNEGYDNLENMYNQLTAQFSRYMGHVGKNIGGIYENPKTVEQSGAIYEYVPAATQKEAMLFFDQQLFTTPSWMLNKQILSEIGQNPVQVVYKLQNGVLDRIVTNHNMYKLISAEAANGNSAYKITDFFGDMQNMIFKELKSNQPIDVYRRNLQKMYVAKLIELIKPAAAGQTTLLAQLGGGRGPNFVPDPEKEDTDVMSVAKAQLRSIATLVKTSLPGVTDSLSNYHLMDLNERITEALDPKR